MNVAERKAALRRLMRARRQAASSNGRAAEGESRRVQARFLEAFPPREGQRLALYAAVPGEVGTDLIREAALAAGALLFYPVFTEDDRLLFYPHGADGGWVKGRFGLKEPAVVPGTLPVVNGFDVMVVPGLAFDPAGRRLGHGFGSYDMFLKGLAGGPLKAGLAYSWQLLDEIPADPWDVPVDVVVTEKGVLGAGSTPGAARREGSTSMGGRP